MTDQLCLPDRSPARAVPDSHPRARSLVTRLGKIVRLDPCCGILIMVAPLVGLALLGRWAANRGLLTNPAVLASIAGPLVALIVAFARSRRRGTTCAPHRTQRASGGGRARTRAG